MKFRNPPTRLPCLVRITTFHLEKGEGTEPTGARKILDQIADAYGPSCSEVEGALKLALESSEIYVEGTEEEDSQTFLVALSPGEDEECSSTLLGEPAGHGDQIEELMELLPQDALCVFDLRVASVTGREEAQSLLKGYVRRIHHRPRSMGVIRGCVLAGLQESLAPSSQPLRREFLLLPLNHELDEATPIVWGLCREMAALASCAGRLNHLRSRHDLVLRQIDASEQNTLMRINEILAGLRLPVAQIQAGRLEGILTEVTTLFSRLSILVGGMRRDYVRAQALLRDVDGLFMMWNEESLDYYPTNSSVEAHACERIVAPFKDYIERVEAVRVQLNTVLDAVRTYLEIQGQRMSVEEQKSSKEQLIRLVNLQEMLHKLEILIVAVYLTEMARIVFEAVARERALVLTAAFIPVALGLAVLIARLLHREG